MDTGKERDPALDMIIDDGNEEENRQTGNTLRVPGSRERDGSGGPPDLDANLAGLRSLSSVKL